MLAIKLESIDKNGLVTFTSNLPIDDIIYDKIKVNSFSEDVNLDDLLISSVQITK